MKTKAGVLRVALNIYGDDATANYRLLEEERASIDVELGDGLDWDPMETCKGCQISRELTDVDPADANDPPRQHAWIVKQLNSFHRAFSRRVKAIDPGD